MDIFSPKQCFEFKNVLMDLFITNTQDWIHVEYLWIIVMFLSAVWTLIQQHPFTAEDPLVSRWCNATLLKICSDEETNSSTSWMA